MDNLNKKRERNRIELKKFSFNMRNIFDRPTDELILNLKKQIEDEYSEHDKWIDIQTNQPSKYDELQEIADRSDISLYEQMYDYIRTAQFHEDEVQTLFEMKIIYSFKHLEINIKSLISKAYNEASISKQSKWESLIQYLKSKNIEVKNLDEYKEVNQLRIVNNSLKHSNESFDNSLSHIEEFKKAEFINYENLELFYERIKSVPQKFLDSLTKEIHKDLYSFDDSKISNLAESIVLRMGKDDALKFVKIISNHYI